MCELGIISACFMKQERGEITKGRWFKLDEGQEDLLRKARNWHKYRGSLNLWDKNHAKCQEAKIAAELDKMASNLLFEEGKGLEKDHTKAYNLLTKSLKNIDGSIFKRIYKRWCREDHHLPKNFLLAGTSGTGKTIVLAEVMHMRIAHYVRKDVPLWIIIAVWDNNADILVENLKEKYFPSLKENEILKRRGTNIEFFSGYESLGEKFGVSLEESKLHEKDKVAGSLKSTTIEKLNALLQKMSTCANKKILFFLDEFSLEVTDPAGQRKQDFSKLIVELENVEFFIAVSPWGGAMQHKFVPPESSKILARQLTGRHRNSAHIQYLNMHRIGNAGLNGKADKIDPTTLPKGSTPLYILRKHDIPNREVLRFIEEGRYIDEDQSVTIVSRDGRDEEIDAWCANEKHHRKNSAMTGCEDDVIICFDNSYNEDLTRARETLIIVFEPNSMLVTQIEIKDIFFPICLNFLML